MRLAESKHTLYRETTKHQKVCSNRLHLYEKPTGCMTNVGLRLKKPAMTMTSTSHSSLTRLTAICYGSRAPTVYVLQHFLWFPDYEHFGFQGLRVANGGEDRSFHLTEGSVPIQTSGLARYPTSSRWGLQETNGRRPTAAWVDCSSNHTHLEWSWAPTVVERFPGKARRPRKGLENPPHYGHVLP